MEELLCSPEDELENCQDLELIVCTLRPIGHESGRSSEYSEECDPKGRGSSELPLNNTNITDVENGLGSSKMCSSETRGDSSALWHRNSQETSKEETQCDLFEENTVQTNVSGRMFLSQASGEGREREKKTEEETLNKETNAGDPMKALRDFQSILACYISEQKPYILDVDMDFFSTQNPFKGLYTEVLYNYTVQSAYSSKVMTSQK